MSLQQAYATLSKAHEKAQAGQGRGDGEEEVQVGKAMSGIKVRWWSAEVWAVRSAGP